MFERESNTDLRERYPDIEIEVCSSTSTEQSTIVKNMEGKELICNEIYGISPFVCYPSLGIEDTSELSENKYVVFGSTMGFPNTSSIVIPPHLKDSELRFDISLLSETSFYTQYFKMSRERVGYVRYFCDFAFDDWNRRNIPTLVDRLNSKGISVRIFKEGEKNYNDDEYNIYHCLLLFTHNKESVDN